MIQITKATNNIWIVETKLGGKLVLESWDELIEYLKNNIGPK